MAWRENSKLLSKEFRNEFFGDNKWLSDCVKSESQRFKGKRVPAIVWCGLKRFIKTGFTIFKKHSFGILYGLFSFITHSYLVFIAIFFFFQNYIPENLINLADSLSEPYLGIIGIYLVLKEVAIRTGQPVKTGALREAFVTAWVLLLFVSTLLTFVSESYHVDDVYRLIITNSLASVIIRIGTLFKY